MSSSMRRRKFYAVAVVGLAVVVIASAAIAHFFISRSIGSATRSSSTLKVIRNAEMTYRDAYPMVGFARNLFTLGPASTSSTQCDAAHACFLDSVLACPEGAGQGWCRKGSYRYNIQSSSKKPPFQDYWVSATPISSSSGLKNYCAYRDGIVRSEPAKARLIPFTRDECLALPVDNELKGTN